MSSLYGHPFFATRFTPPYSVTSKPKTQGIQRAQVLQQPSAFRIAPNSSSLGRNVHGFPPSPADTTSPYLATSTGSRPAELAPLSLEAGLDKEFGNNTRQHVVTQLSEGALIGLDRSQTISTSMLAHDHLPKIMLGNGPLATRHIMSCLAQTIPGFSRIAPNKARKMLLDALMMRTVPLGDGLVEFRKAERGRWHAHVVGDASGHPADLDKHAKRHAASESDVESCAISRPGSEAPPSPDARFRDVWASISMRSHDEAADDMSMDDEASSGEETEAEDWFSKGPQAMRDSVPAAVKVTHKRFNYNAAAMSSSMYRRRFSSSTSRSRQWSRPALVTSIAAQQALPSLSPGEQRSAPTHSIQERDAIQALLQLGSM